MATQPLVALDIGSTKVACAIGLPCERAAGFELVGTSLIPYPTLSDAWLSDPLLVSRTIERALEATAVSGDFHRALVAVNHPSLSSERVRVAITLGDEPMTVRAQDVSRLERSALHQALGIDREALVVEPLGFSGNGFEEVRDPRGLSATRLLGTFLVIAMPMAARRALVQAVESAGLEVAQLAYTLQTAMACAADEGVGQKRVLLVDVGGLTTDVGFAVEGLLRALEVLPWGGLKLAAAIAKDLHVTMDQAVTWSLEGTGCRKPEVRELVKRQWELLRQALDNVLKDEPRPDAILLSGRGALIDGFAEWLERATGTGISWCRSDRTNRLGDLSRQVGLGTAIGLLERATRASNGSALRAPRLFNRLIDRTRTILTEYF